MTHALLIAVLGVTLMATAGDAMAQVAGSVTLGTSVEVTKAIAVGHRASKLIGAAVYNDREERVGKPRQNIHYSRVHVSRPCRMGVSPEISIPTLSILTGVILPLHGLVTR